MTYKIDGMTCNACKMLIEMAFEDQGYKDFSGDLETETLTVPDGAGCSEEMICDVVESAGAYKVIKI